MYIDTWYYKYRSDTKVAVTKEAVATACAQITADGKAVTQAGVRTIVGGSYSTIGPLITEWREEQSKTETLAKVEVPVEVSEATRTYEANVWKIATESARAGQEAMRLELLDTKAKSKQQSSELNEIIAEVEMERDASVFSLDAITASHDALTVTSASLTERIASLNGDLAAASARADATEADAERSKKDAAAAHEDRIQMRTERNSAAATLAECRLQMSNLSDLKDKIEVDAKAEIERTRVQSKIEVDAVRKEAKEAAATMREEVASHADRADRLSADLVAATDRAARAEEQAVALRADIERLTAMNAAHEVAGAQPAKAG